MRARARGTTRKIVETRAAPISGTIRRVDGFRSYDAVRAVIWKGREVAEYLVDHPPECAMQQDRPEDSGGLICLNGSPDPGR